MVIYLISYHIFQGTGNKNHGLDRGTGLVSYLKMEKIDTAMGWLVFYGI